MKAVYIKNFGFWSVVLLVGVALVAAGLFQMADYPGSRNGGVGDPPPASGESVKTGAEKPTPEAPKAANQVLIEYKLERNRMKSQQIELFRELVNNPHSTDQDRSEAQRKLISISTSMETEMKLENLIKAEDYKDAVAFVQENSATVIVQTPILTAPDKERLTGITARTTGLKPENIVIIPKN